MVFTQRSFYKRVAADNVEIQCVKMVALEENVNENSRICKDKLPFNRIKSVLIQNDDYFYKIRHK